MRDVSPALGRWGFGTVASDLKGCEFAPYTPLAQCELGDRVAIPAAKVLTVVGEAPHEHASLLAKHGPGVLRNRVGKCMLMTGYSQLDRGKASSREFRQRMDKSLTVEAIIALLDTTGSRDHRETRRMAAVSTIRTRASSWTCSCTSSRWRRHQC